MLWATLGGHRNLSRPCRLLSDTTVPHCLTLTPTHPFIPHPPPTPSATSKTQLLSNYTSLIIYLHETDVCLYVCVSSVRVSTHRQICSLFTAYNCLKVYIFHFLQHNLKQYVEIITKRELLKSVTSYSASALKYKLHRQGHC